jgi:hypothetical protein
MDGCIYGFAMQQVNLPLHTPEEVADVGKNILQQLPAADYPHLAEMIIDHAMRPGYDYSDEFEFGLDLILDGLKRLVELPPLTAEQVRDKLEQTLSP